MKTLSVLQFWQRNRVTDFATFIVRRMLELKMTGVAASLTFTTMLAIVPFFTVALIVLSAFPVFSEFSARFRDNVFNALVPEYAEKVGEYINTFITNVSHLTAPGLIFLAVVALMLLRTIEEAFNGIWCVRRSRSLRLQLLVYWMILTLGPLLIGIGFTVWRWLNQYIVLSPGINNYVVLVQHFNSFVLTVIFLFLVYRFVPNRHVYSRHALTGAVVAAIFIGFARSAFSWYIGKIASYQLVYGAFASLPVFLLWLYCLWLIVLGGAIIAASMSYWRGTAWRRAQDFRRNFQDAVEMLLMLYRAQQNGGSLTVAQIRRNLNAADEQIYYLLDIMAQRDFVQQGNDDQGESWVLKTSADQLAIGDIMRLFLDEHTFANDNPIEAELRHLLRPLFESLDVSLAVFAQRLKGQNPC